MAPFRGILNALEYCPCVFSLLLFENNRGPRYNFAPVPANSLGGPDFHNPGPNENKSCMRVDETWDMTACIRVFSSLASWSNENKSWVRIHDTRVYECSITGVSISLSCWSNENKTCKRVVESGQARVFLRVFSSVGQTRTRLA